jgi:hypothetical protein
VYVCARERETPEMSLLCDVITWSVLAVRRSTSQSASWTNRLTFYIFHAFQMGYTSGKNVPDKEGAYRHRNKRGNSEKFRGFFYSDLEIFRKNVALSYPFIFLYYSFVIFHKILLGAVIPSLATLLKSDRKVWDFENFDVSLIG